MMVLKISEVELRLSGESGGAKAVGGDKIDCSVRRTTTGPNPVSCGVQSFTLAPAPPPPLKRVAQTRYVSD